MNGFMFQAGRVAVLVFGIAAGGVAHAQNATTGQINFTGSIKDVPCTIDASTSTTVSLGENLDIQTLRGHVGKTSPPVDFRVVLSGCGAGSAGAVLKFAGTQDTTNSKALALNAGGAEGVAVQLVDQDGTTPIDIGGGGAARDLTIAEGSNTYNFKAQYVSTNSTIKPGRANTTALFSLTYK